LEKVFEKCERSGVKMGKLERIGSWVAGGGDWFALFALVHILR
jgi:hypothetical protein